MVGGAPPWVFEEVQGWGVRARSGLLDRSGVSLGSHSQRPRLPRLPGSEAGGPERGGKRLCLFAALISGPYHLLFAHREFWRGLEVTGAQGGADGMCPDSLQVL